MKIRSLVGFIIVFIFAFGYVSDAFAYSSSSRSSSSTSKSSSSSYKSKSSSSSTSKSSGINLKKSPTTKSTTTNKSTTTSKSSTTTTKPSTSSNINIKKKPYTSPIKSKPKTTSHYYNGHKVYSSAGSSVIFINADGSDCDYDDLLEGDDDCEAFYADDDDYDAPKTQVKSVSSGPSAGLIVFRWIMGIIFFSILILVLLLIAKRMRKF